MNGGLIEWLASLSAVLFASTALALGYRVLVNMSEGVRVLALRNQIAAGGGMLFAALAIDEGRDWAIWHAIQQGLRYRDAAAGLEWAFWTPYALQLIGGMLFVRAATVERCGEKVWLSALGITVAGRLVWGVLA